MAQPRGMNRGQLFVGRGIEGRWFGTVPGAAEMILRVQQPRHDFVGRKLVWSRQLAWNRSDVLTGSDELEPSREPVATTR